MPNYLIACDKFKGSLSSRQAGEALAAGLRAADPAAGLKILEVADGGQGFLDALTACSGLERIDADCRDALGRPRRGEIGLGRDGLAYLESAMAIGLPWLRPGERNPWLAHSAGLADLILAALRHRPTRIIIGLGGSASCDGGLGCLEALGWRLLDARGRDLPGRPASLAQIRRIEPPAITLPPIDLVCDVASPALGPLGGVQVYSPQKGADPAMVSALETGMRNWCDVLAAFCRRPLRALAGGGAAGALGLGLHVALNAPLLPGADWLLDRLDFDEALAWAEVVITGEGAFDASSLAGKITGRILARAAGKTRVIVSGRWLTAGSVPADHAFSLQTAPNQPEPDPDESLARLQDIGSELAEIFSP